MRVRSVQAFNGFRQYFSSPAPDSDFAQSAVRTKRSHAQRPGSSPAMRRSATMGAGAAWRGARKSLSTSKSLGAKRPGTVDTSEHGQQRPVRRSFTPGIRSGRARSPDAAAGHRNAWTPGASKTFSVVVDATDEAGAPVQGATAVVRGQQDGLQMDASVTNVRGTCELHVRVDRGSARHTWDLLVSHDGFEPVKRKVRLHNTRSYAQVRLVRTGGGDDDVASGDTVDVVVRCVNGVTRAPTTGVQCELYFPDGKEPIASAVSDMGGTAVLAVPRATAPLPKQWVTLRTSKAGFARVEQRVRVGEDGTETLGVVVPPPPAHNVRVTLTWTGGPANLDLHMLTQRGGDACYGAQDGAGVPLTYNADPVAMVAPITITVPSRDADEWYVARARVSTLSLR